MISKPQGRQEMENFSLYHFEEQTKNFSVTNKLPQSLLLSSSGDFKTFYAPFEYINRSAKVVICGITPGLQQASIALETAGQLLREGSSVAEAQKIAKSKASFAGAMRNNLVAMLDHAGLQERLGLESTAELFSSRKDLVHYTSALRNPVFYKDKNYSGTPPMLKHACLKWQIDNFLTEEGDALSDAVWIPLGPKVTDALIYLSTQGIVEEERILDGLPHPSGANAERVSIFVGRKAPELASSKTNPDSIFERRKAIIQKIAAL